MLELDLFRVNGRAWHYRNRFQRPLEEMLGLLCEYVAEKIGVQNDPERVRFLTALSAELDDLADRAPGLSADEAIEQLRAIDAFQRDDFAGDPVLTHVEACLEELQRIQSQR